MENNPKEIGLDIPYLISIFFLLAFGVLILNSIAKTIFPLYFFYIVLGLGAFFLFSKLDFEVISAFSKIFYIDLVG